MIKQFIWRTALVIIGILFAVTVIVFLKPSEALGMCPSNSDCGTYSTTMVHKFKHHKLGNSHGLTFPRKFKREFHQAARQWRRHHQTKIYGISNPFNPIKEFVEDQMNKTACGISSAVTHNGGGNCSQIGAAQWPSVKRFQDNMGYVADVTIGCGGGALIASFNRPENWKMLVTRYGYRFNPWVLGTGFAACTFTTVWFATHGH